MDLPFRQLDKLSGNDRTLRRRGDGGVAGLKRKMGPSNKCWVRNERLRRIISNVTGLVGQSRHQQQMSFSFPRRMILKRRFPKRFRPRRQCEQSQIALASEITRAEIISISQLVIVCCCPPACFCRKI